MYVHSSNKFIFTAANIYMNSTATNICMRITAANMFMNITAANMCMSITATHTRMNIRAANVCMSITAANICMNILSAFKDTWQKNGTNTKPVGFGSLAF